MDNIIPFRQGYATAADDLESALEKAKTGEIRAVCICWVTEHGSIGGTISQGRDNFAMLASLKHTKRTFENNVFEPDW